VGELKARAKMISTTEEIAQVGITSNTWVQGWDPPCLQGWEGCWCWGRGYLAVAAGCSGGRVQHSSRCHAARHRPCLSRCQTSCNCAASSSLFASPGGHHLRQRRARDWRPHRPRHGEGAAGIQHVQSTEMTVCACNVVAPAAQLETQVAMHSDGAACACDAAASTPQLMGGRRGARRAPLQVFNRAPSG